MLQDKCTRVAGIVGVTLHYKKGKSQNLPARSQNPSAASLSLIFMAGFYDEKEKEKKKEEASLLKETLSVEHPRPTFSGDHEGRR